VTAGVQRCSVLCQKQGRRRTWSLRLRPVWSFPATEPTSSPTRRRARWRARQTNRDAGECRHRACAHSPCGYLRRLASPEDSYHRSCLFSTRGAPRLQRAPGIGPPSTLARLDLSQRRATPLPLRIKAALKRVGRWG
jgi:hypothetical protein